MGDGDYTRLYQLPDTASDASSTGTSTSTSTSKNNTPFFFYALYLAAH
jgi:hypothetical protein